MQSIEIERMTLEEEWETSVWLMLPKSMHYIFSVSALIVPLRERYALVFKEHYKEDRFKSTNQINMESFLSLFTPNKMKDSIFFRSFTERRNNENSSLRWCIVHIEIFQFPLWFAWGTQTVELISFLSLLVLSWTSFSEVACTADTRTYFPSDSNRSIDSIVRASNCKKMYM